MIADDAAGHGLRWDCPECNVRLRAMAQDLDTAEAALVSVVREHAAQFHHGPVNPVAAASWLFPTGQQAELWGGPFDGTQVWVPPGDLPPVIGATRTEDGAVVPIRCDVGRLLTLEHAAVYRLDEDHPALVYRFDHRRQQ